MDRMYVGGALFVVRARFPTICQFVTLILCSNQEFFELRFIDTAFRAEPTSEVQGVAAGAVALVTPEDAAVIGLVTLIAAGRGVVAAHAARAVAANARTIFIALPFRRPLGRNHVG
jgi:hypothetical protein